MEVSAFPQHIFTTIPSLNNNNNTSPPPQTPTSFFPRTTSTFPPAFAPIRWGNNVIGIDGSVVRFRVGVTKKPMDTPGAYEVIDEESGERVIVWGGVDDDSILPSKEVLSWNPNKQGKKSRGNSSKTLGSEPPSDRQDNGASSVTARKLATKFGRLRPLKIKSHVRNVSPEKVETSKDRYEEVDTEESNVNDDLAVSFDSEDMSKMRKKKISGKGGIDKILDSRRSINSFESKGDAAAIKVSRHSKGWNNREPAEDSRVFRGEQRDLKFNAKYTPRADFFSRKSFRDLGCSDDMVESLRAQDFAHPAHIHVSSSS